MLSSKQMNLDAFGTALHRLELDIYDLLIQRIYMDIIADYYHISQPVKAEQQKQISKQRSREGNLGIRLWVLSLGTHTVGVCRTTPFAGSVLSLVDECL